MSSTAWVFQKGEDLDKMGAEKASWYVGWYEPDGTRKKKSFGPGFRGKKEAERYKNKVENDLMAGTYQMTPLKQWADFRQEYERRIVPRLAARSREPVKTALDHFERIIKPVRVLVIATHHIDDFIAVRRTEPGKKKGDLVSPATVNKDLRHLKAALNVAVEWGYLARLPKFRMEREPKKLPRYVLPDHFTAVYGACEKATMPEGLPYPPADWWRGLIVTGYMTGWRIGDMLGLARADLDLEAGVAITRLEDNKGKRDERVKLHPVVVEHLRRIPGFTPTVFPWNHDERTLWDEFGRVQVAAGIHLPCRGKHEHTPSCHVYGFHDLRRAFATMNADRLTPDALQALMRHKSYLTTQVYINMSRQLDDAVASLHVPEVLKGKVSGG